VSDSAED